tara:strand:+ start:4306 stop:4947 length:642 start_codon:yes stop_codon:yes gene_type:complete
MNYINKIILLLPTSIALFSCTNNTNITNNDYSLNDFSLKQLDHIGSPNFTLDSSNAQINPVSNNIEAENVEIILFQNKLFKNISSSLCIFNRLKNTIELKDNIIIKGFTSKNTYVKADYLKWNIDDSTILLHGNINLNYQSTNLTSDNAIYNGSNNKLIFTGINKYTIYNKNKFNPLLILNSTKAILDSKTKYLEFTSDNSQVESIINLNQFN